MFAFELIQSGLAPSVVLQLVREHWNDRLRPIFDEAETAVMRDGDGANDVVLLLAGMSLISDAVPNINHVRMRRLSGRLDLALSGNVKLPARAVTINLTAQLRLFHTALADVHLLPDRDLKTSKPVKRGK